MSSRDRRLIAEDIADLVDSTYGLDPAPLRRIVERQRLDVFLLRRIRRNGGYRRAYYLHLLSRMPVDEKQFGQWNVIRIAGTVMSASVR